MSLNSTIFQGFLVDGYIEDDDFTPDQQELIKEVFSLFKTTLILLKHLGRNNLNNERLNQTFRVAQMMLNDWVYDVTYYESTDFHQYDKDNLLANFEELQEYHSPTKLLTNILTILDQLDQDELNSFDKQEHNIREVAVELYEYL